MIFLPDNEVDQVVLQTNQVNAFSLHLPNWKHGFQVHHTISLDHPNVNSLANTSGGPQHAVLKTNSNGEKGKNKSVNK